MKEVLYFALFNFLAIYATWLYYLAIMNLKQSKDELNGYVKLFGYPLGLIGVIFDVYIQLIPASILFLDLPKDLLLTGRMRRYKNCNDDWRNKVALWFCMHFLDPFDPSGMHCGGKCEEK